MSSISLSSLSILLIEPSPTQRKIIVDLLSDAGAFNVEGVETGLEALKIIKQYPPDLVLTALYLPDIGAAELISVAKKCKNETETFFMLVSSETHHENLDDVVQAGIVCMLPKPFDHEDIEQALATTIDFMTPKQLQLDNYDLNSFNVLLVDDSLTARNHISRVLNNLGIINITKAKDGKQGLELFQQDNFDLIVTDLNMPIMNGKELVHYIRNDLDNSLIPILMVTSDDDESHHEEVRQAGVTAICDKPFEPNTIRQLLADIFN